MLLIRAFRAIDINQTGYIEKKALINYLIKQGYPTKEATKRASNLMKVMFLHACYSQHVHDRRLTTVFLLMRSDLQFVDVRRKYCFEQAAPQTN